MSFARRSLLLATKTSAVALAVSLSNPAYAANECGDPTSGPIVCDSADAPFPSGISYALDTGFTLSIVSGVAVEPTSGLTALSIASTSGTATVTNAGTIKGGTGYAVRVESGTLALTNSGTIQGGLLLSDGNDVITNTGTFIVDKDSDFGAGTDLFKSSGTVKFAAATAPRNFKFIGLEKFENSGLIDLRNGVVGDVFTLSGAFVGTGDSTLGLDVDFDKEKADKIIVTGAATGSTTLALKLTGDQARLTSGDGIVVAEAGSGSTGSALRLEDPYSDIGFVRYGLDYNSSARKFLLVGTAGPGAYRQLGAIEAVNDAWFASANAFRSNEAGSREAFWARDDAGKSKRGRIWVEGYGSAGERDAKTWVVIGDLGSIADHSYKTERVGGQAGADLAAYADKDGVYRFGLTGGFAKSKLETSESDDRFEVETSNIGLYASATTEVMFGSILAKYDRHNVDYDAVTTGFAARSKGSTLGMEAEVGTQFGNETYFLEPLIGVSWTRTTLDDVDALGQRLEYDDASVLRAKVGTNFGGKSRLGGGNSLTFFGSAKVVSQRGGKYGLTLHSGDNAQSIASKQDSTFAELLLRVGYVTPGGIEAFVQAEGEGGKARSSIGGSAGLRLSF